MSRLDEEIRKGIFHRVYLFYGEEEYLKDYYTKALCRALGLEDDAMNLHRWQGKDVDVSAVIEQAMTMPFFADHRLILIGNSGLFQKGGQEMAAALPALPEETILVFSEEEVDQRSKLFLTVKSIGFPMKFDHPNQSSLMNLVVKRLDREGKKIRNSAMQLFLERVGDDMTYITLELEKLLGYTYGREAISREDVEAVICVQTENRIYEMIDAVAVKQQDKALRLFYDLLQLKVSAYSILAGIARQFRQIMVVQDLREQGFDQNAIVQKTGIRDFIVRKNLRQATHFTPAQVRQILETCAWAEQAGKTGRMQDVKAVELVLVQASAG